MAGAAAAIEVDPELPLAVARTQAASALGLDTEPAFVLQGCLLPEADDGRPLRELGLVEGCFVVAVVARATPPAPEAPPVAPGVPATPAAPGRPRPSRAPFSLEDELARQMEVDEDERAAPAAAAPAAGSHDAELARQLQADEDERTARRVQEMQDGDLARQEQARMLGEQRAADVATMPALCFVRGELPACPGKWIPLLVDTGAQTSVMTSGLAERLGLLAALDRSASGIAGGIGQARVLGRLRSVTVRFGELDLEVDFSVLDGAQMPAANLAILGLDQLAVHHMVVDLCGRVLRVGGVEGYAVRFLERYEVPDEFRLDGGNQRCAVQ